MYNIRYSVTFLFKKVFIDYPCIKILGLPKKKMSSYVTVEKQLKIKYWNLLTGIFTTFDGVLVYFSISTGG